MNSGGMSRRIVAVVMAWIGHVRGSLGYVAGLAALPMAAMSGSATADGAVLGVILLPMMRSAGYDVPRSAGLISTAACIAPVLPPSGALIIFGVIANVSRPVAGRCAAAFAIASSQAGTCSRSL